MVFTWGEGLVRKKLEGERAAPQAGASSAGSNSVGLGSDGVASGRARLQHRPLTDRAVSCRRCPPVE